MVKPKSKGYFARDRFEHLDGGDAVAEIALNPRLFAERSMKDTLSTLVHEMCHLWQAAHGEKFPSRPYHNREWADKMLEVGLHPSDTGAEGGKETGVNMTHYIVAEGPFCEAADKWLAMTGATLPYAATGGEVAKKKAASKTKFTCPTCGANAWGKPDLQIRCGSCDEDMEEGA